MDITILIAMSVLAVLAFAEIFCILHNNGRKKKTAEFIAVIPVFPNDTDLAERLCSISEKITRGTFRADAVFIIDYGADDEQTQLCRQFCNENPCSEIVLPENFEKILRETFAIEEKI